MADPSIIAATIAGAVSILALADSRLHRREVAKAQAEAEFRARVDAEAAEDAEVHVARLGDDATLRAQLHAWFKAEREGHEECRREAAEARTKAAEVEAAFVVFRSEHPDCSSRIATLTRRIASLEAERERAAE